VLGSFLAPRWTRWFAERVYVMSAWGLRRMQRLFCLPELQTHVYCVPTPTPTTVATNSKPKTAPSAKRSTRTLGIEPRSSTRQADVLPLYYARSARVSRHSAGSVSGASYTTQHRAEPVRRSGDRAEAHHASSSRWRCGARGLDSRRYTRLPCAHEPYGITCRPRAVRASTGLAKRCRGLIVEPTWRRQI
jgi:hypothetical protein